MNSHVHDLTDRRFGFHVVADPRTPRNCIALFVPPHPIPGSVRPNPDHHGFTLAWSPARVLAVLRFCASGT